MWDLEAEASERWQEDVGRDAERRRVKHTGTSDEEGCGTFFSSFVNLGSSWKPFGVPMVTQSERATGPRAPFTAPPSVPASLPAHCSPSSLNLLPFCHCCLPSYPTPLLTASPTVCPSLTRRLQSHTVFYCSVNSTRTRKLRRAVQRDGDKGPTCPCLQSNMKN